jgi:ribosomal protein S18 acetylase RimI-like enzyme
MVKAFWSSPETVHLLPDEHQRGRVLPRYLLSDVRDAARFDLLFGAEVDGGIAGAAAWIPPQAYPVSLGRQVRQALDLAPALPWGWRALREAQRGQAANRARHRVHPKHYYLRAIAVDPGVQSQGLGSSLVGPVLEMADRDRVGCFLQTATSTNVSWYERFGFRVVETYRPTPSWPDVWAMWRDPIGESDEPAVGDSQQARGGRMSLRRRGADVGTAGFPTSSGAALTG